VYTASNSIVSMSVMLQTPSRASTASSSSYQALSRQNTMSSYDGSRSARQSKRYSMSALYMSMSAQETDLEIEDDLAKGLFAPCPSALPRALN
jgi:Ras GTPase-activating-like protein IQGAP2/3